MKRTIWALFVGWFSTFSSFAQQDEVQLIQSIWGMAKKDIVTDYMRFSPVEASAFWPVYESFQEELKNLGGERILIIADYANNLEKMTDLKADELAMKILKNNMATDKLQVKYYGKFKKAVGPLRASSYLQLELYLQTMVRAEIQNELPMIGELDKKAK